MNELNAEPKRLSQLISEKRQPFAYICTEIDVLYLFENFIKSVDITPIKETFRKYSSVRYFAIALELMTFFRLIFLDSEIHGSLLCGK